MDPHILENTRIDRPLQRLSQEIEVNGVSNNLLPRASLLNHRARLLSDLHCQVVKNGVWLFSKFPSEVEPNFA